MLFIGRIAELKKLNEMYASDEFECAILCGRRRVGKTTLIREFIKTKERFTSSHAKRTVW